MELPTASITPISNEMTYTGVWSGPRLEWDAKNIKVNFDGTVQPSVLQMEYIALAFLQVIGFVTEKRVLDVHDFADQFFAKLSMVSDWRDV